MLVEASAEQREHYRREGWLHVPGLVTRRQCDELIELVLPHIPDPTRPNTYIIDSELWYAEPRIRELWHRSVVEHFVRTLLGDPAVDVRLTAGGIHALGPGTDERTYWHQEAAVSADPWGPYMCAAWVALTDVPARRAPLIVVPRSHIDPTPTFGAGLRYGFDRFDQVRTVEDDENAFPECIPIEAGAGDAVFFDQWTIHASRPNTDTLPRIALTGRYRVANSVPRVGA
ncbi:MAG: phytanoyl-CoA dioxygenase family protein [Acidimicrobiales bacterium]